MCNYNGSYNGLICIARKTTKINILMICVSTDDDLIKFFGFVFQKY